MPIDKRILLETIKSKISEIDERSPNYRLLLLEVVANIYELEVTHKSRQTNIDQQILDLIIDKAKVLDTINDN